MTPGFDSYKKVGGQKITCPASYSAMLDQFKKSFLTVELTQRVGNFEWKYEDDLHSITILIKFVLHFLMFYVGTFYTSCYDL